jgi:nitroreductase
MASNWQLNGFYDATKLTGLYEAARRRVSCRSFAAAPMCEQWNALLSAVDTLTLPGARIALGMCENTLFQPMFGLLMKFENVQRFAAVIAHDDTPQSAVDAGVSGEMLMLRAVELGLGGVWVSGTFKRGQVGIKLAAGEKLLALIALGVPKVEQADNPARKRKEIAALCPEIDTLPPALREVAQYVRIAPSAMNMQPWRITMVNENEVTLAVSLPYQRLDLGIAIAHAVLALGSTPALLSLDDTGLVASIELR